MKKFYITTAIPYVNAPPHIGFALELIQADVMARWHRQKGNDVFFLTGADQHGSKVVKTAKEQNKEIKDLVKENTDKYKELLNVLNISNDNFIETIDKKNHWPKAQEIWNKLKEKGDIYKDKYKGLYCIGCEAFVQERDLANGKCPEHNKEPEILEEENYFFKLSKYISKIRDLIEKDKLKVVPKERKNEILKLLENTSDVSFSRPKEILPWGIPVPGDAEHTIYVWCDALINYLSGDKKNFWPADVHVIGKGILRFHAGIWPGILLSAGLELPKIILVHGYVTSNGQKMSKSIGNAIDPFALCAKYGADAVRYYLLREIPTTKDGDFSEEKFIERYNADLANDLGNLINRTKKLLENIKPGPEDKDFINKIDKKIQEFSFDGALEIIWQKIKWANKFIDQERLWESKDEKKLGQVKTAIEQIKSALEPFLPETKYFYPRMD